MSGSAQTSADTQQSMDAMILSKPLRSHAADRRSVVAPQDRNQVTSVRIEGALACGCAASAGRTRTALREAYVDRQHIMSAFRIYHDGRYYRYSGYRYDCLGDAVAHAELMQTRQSTEVGPDPFAPGEPMPMPTASELELMATWCISFEAGVYAYREFRYDHLADAVSYARLDIGKRASPYVVRAGGRTGNERG
jgi:hypothetical protein